MNKPLSALNTDLELKPKSNYRWTVVIWLLIGGIINYLDRATLSVAAPEMMKDLHLSNSEIGLLGTVFAWSYAMMQLPSGWLIDRFGARKIYTLALIWWSAATLFTGLVSSLWLFILMRLLLGVGEAPCYPTAAKITSSWFPKKERGLAAGIWDSSSKWGPALAPPLLILIMVSFGWRALFYLTGTLGIVFGLIFFIFYRNPDKSKKLTRQELAFIQADGAGKEQTITASNIRWIDLFRHRSIWGMISGYFCTVWTWNIFLVFLPLYLLAEYHVSLSQLGLYASIPWLGGAFGNIIGGYITKKMIDKNPDSPIKCRQIFMSICAILSAVTVISLPYANSIEVTLGLLTLALGFISAITGNAWALAGDIAPPSMVASVGSIQNFGGYFGGAFSPVVAGFIVDTTGSYSLAFISGGIIAGCAALCYFFIVKEPIRES